MGKLTGLNNINKKISKAAHKSSTDFLNSFLDREEEILSLLKDFKGSKSELYLKEVDNDLANQLRFSTIFSDVTLLSTAESGITEYEIEFHDPGSKYFKERQVTIPSEYVQAIGQNTTLIRPVYIHRNTEETKKIFKEYKPLIYDNRLIVRPMRALYVKDGETSGSLYDIDQNTNTEHWFVNSKPATENDTIRIDNGYNKIKSITDLFDVTLPYFDGVDLELLTKILNDEDALLNAFRYDIIKIINEAAGEPAKLQQIKDDIAYSSIDKLTHRFKQIKSNHKQKVYGALGFFVLTLAIVLFDYKAAIPAVGVAVYKMSDVKADYQLKVIELNDKQYYLLWRISRARK